MTSSESARMSDPARTPTPASVAAWIGARNFKRWTDLAAFIDRCYPGSFLAWFSQIVINETRELGRKDRQVTKHETVESALPGPATDEARGERSPLDAALYAAQQAGLPENDIREVERLATRSWLIDKLRACLENARREFILIGHFFLDLNASEIARHLAVSVQVVYTEKNRAIARIRKCCADLRAELELILTA